MLANSLLLLASAALTLASPIRYANDASCSSHPKPILPLNGGERELPSPPPNATLKHIALGVGIQNYTCTGANAQPTLQGAVAMLYDITNRYPTQESTKALWAALPMWSRNSPSPLNMSPDGIGASSVDPFPQDEDFVSTTFGSLPFLGHHYFNAAGVPVFDLKTTNEIMFSKKVDGIKAPYVSDVDWLYLGDAGGSVGVHHVYRVTTAGGVSYGCSAQGVHSVAYGTMYWFYG